MTRVKKNCAALLFLGWLLAPGFLFAQDNVSSEPIHIEADRMESDQKSAMVFFNGNVEANQGELVIKADTMKVYYQKDGVDNDDKGSGKKVEKLTASGHVEIIREGWVAKGDDVDFNAREQKVVLTGNTRVWQGSNMVIGDRIVLYLNEGKSVIEKQGAGEEGRVKALFYPDSGKSQAK